MFFAPYFLQIFNLGANFSSGQMALMSNLMRIIILGQLLFIIGTFFTALLQSYNHFFVPGIAAAFSRGDQAGDIGVAAPRPGSGGAGGDQVVVNGDYRRGMNGDLHLVIRGTDAVYHRPLKDIYTLYKPCY